MQRMGYSIPSGTHNLLYTQGPEDEEDKVSAAIILLWASEKI